MQVRRLPSRQGTVFSRGRAINCRPKVKFGHSTAPQDISLPNGPTQTRVRVPIGNQVHVQRTMLIIYPAANAPTNLFYAELADYLGLVGDFNMFVATYPSACTVLVVSCHADLIVVLISDCISQTATFVPI